MNTQWRQTMSQPTENQATINKKPYHTPKLSEPYHTPKLTELGNINELTTTNPPPDDGKRDGGSMFNQYGS